jgi:hypothetical protein
MERDELLAPLINIADSCKALLDDSNGMLSVSQERVVSSMFEVDRTLYDLIISLPDVGITSVQKLLSYETRSHLASIIGYAEVLLDETEGTLTAIQAEHAEAIHQNGRYVLTLVTELLDGES